MTELLSDLIAAKSILDIKKLEIRVLGQIFRLGDERLESLSIQFGANERSTSCSFSVIDADLTVADKFFTWSKANGGIKLPIELGEQLQGAGGGTNPIVDIGGSVDLDNIPNGLRDDDLARVIIAYCQKVGLTQKEAIAYILATCEHESAMGVYTEEIGQGAGSDYGATGYWGRGLIQVTWDYNYIKVAKLVGKPDNFFLTPNADLMMELTYAVPALVQGMINGIYTGLRLGDFIVPGSVDYLGARTIVNGNDRDSLIADLARNWESKIDGLAASITSPSTVNVNAASNSAIAKPIPGFVNNVEPVITTITDPQLNSATIAKIPNPESESNGSELKSVDSLSGEKIYIAIETATQFYRHTFILTDTSVTGLPLASISVTGKAVRHELNIEAKTQNFEGVTASEYILITGKQNGITIKDKTVNTESLLLRYIEQRNQTDLDRILRLADNQNITVTDNTLENVIEITNVTPTAKNLIIDHLIEISFADNGVFKELPQYPVKIAVMLSDSVLALKPRDVVTLDNAYSFIPASLRSDTWVISAIALDVFENTASLDLLKYIPTQQTTELGLGSSGNGNTGGSGGSSTINQSIMTAVNSLGQFLTTGFPDPRNACAFAVNRVITTAGYTLVGEPYTYVPAVRTALQQGRGQLINTGQVTAGCIVIAKGCYHIGIATSSNTVRSTSSSRQCFCWDSDLTFDGYYDSNSIDGYNATTEYWQLTK